jgi:hypothetical protein
MIFSSGAREYSEFSGSLTGIITQFTETSADQHDAQLQIAEASTADS